MRQGQDNLYKTNSEICNLEAQIKFVMESTHQRHASNILNGLNAGRERLSEEKNGLNLRDNAHLTNLRMQLEEKPAGLEELAMQLKDAQE